MADVKIVDIDNEQWNMKDQEARNRIAALEELFVTKDLPDVEINLNTGYTATQIEGYSHYKIGKIHFINIIIRDIAGSNVGTANTARVATTSLRPKKETSFIMNDSYNKVAMRCYLDADGTIAIGESTGVTQGSNTCYGGLIFAEA